MMPTRKITAEKPITAAELAKMTDEEKDLFYGRCFTDGPEFDLNAKPKKAPAKRATAKKKG